MSRMSKVSMTTWLTTEHLLPNKHFTLVHSSDSLNINSLQPSKHEKQSCHCSTPVSHNCCAGTNLRLRAAMLPHVVQGFWPRGPADCKFAEVFFGVLGRVLPPKKVLHFAKLTFFGVRWHSKNTCLDEFNSCERNLSGFDNAIFCISLPLRCLRKTNIWIMRSKIQIVRPAPGGKEQGWKRRF